MANGEGAAGIPDALANRRVEVILSNGSKVIVEKWSWSKKMSLLGMVGDPEKLLELVTSSLQPEDRSKASTMADEDVLACAAEAIKLNVTKGLAGKAKALGQVLGDLFGGDKEKSQ